MPEFLVKLADERGHVTEQVESAHNESEVRDRFSQRGLYIQSIRSRGLLAGGKVNFSQRRRIKLQEFVVFNQQFYTLIHAGLPILTGLKLLAQRQRNPYFRSLLEDVRLRVQGGEPLSAAFTAQKVFPRIYTTTLLAGEKSGNLEEVLMRYISYQRVTLTIRKKLLSSLVYPTLLIVAVTVVLTYLITFVVPKFGELYGQLDAQLPAITVFMLNLGTIAQKYFWIIGSAVAFLILFVMRWRKTQSGAERIDRLRLKLPFLGEIWLKYQIAMFSRTLATLLAGGLPLVTCLETAAGSMESRLIANAVSDVTVKVREGQPLASSLESTKVFPDMAVEMIEVGESTGALRPMLNSVAEFFEEDVQTTMAAAMSLIEPVILIGMAIIVGGVLISLYMPIFSLGANGNLGH
ncbi:MAG TPA: type II secretion system F family protein [Terriglobales bacterium]|jgi:type IV pilus assembly protein PilC|nr:type II secretion system F family protein [Terriglobales bacterium]